VLEPGDVAFFAAGPVAAVQGSPEVVEHPDGAKVLALSKRALVDGEEKAPVDARNLTHARGAPTLRQPCCSRT
jgi:hypothetical protein